MKKPLICSKFFPCELSACVSIISYMLTQILFIEHIWFFHNMDYCFFQQEKKNTENISAMQSTISVYF